VNAKDMVEWPKFIYENEKIY